MQYIAVTTCAKKQNPDTENDNNRAHCSLENIISGVNVTIEFTYEKKKQAHHFLKDHRKTNPDHKSMPTCCEHQQYCGIEIAFKRNATCRLNLTIAIAVDYLKSPDLSVCYVIGLPYCVLKKIHADEEYVTHMFQVPYYWCT